MKAKLLRHMMMILTLLGLLTAGAWAANTVSSGTCGEYVNWTLSSDGVLTISGEGAMKSYLSYADVPWYNERNSIKTVVIESGVTSIGKSAFYRCESMTDITIPDTVTKIGWESFQSCRSLTSIDIPDSVTEIIGCAFHNCSALTSVTIPSGVTSLGEGTFAYCTSLVSVTFPDGMTSIGDTTFDGCTSLTSIDIPDSVTAIEDFTFAKCTALTSITIPDGVTSIGHMAFDGCTSLREISIPSGVTSIGRWAFRNCSGLSAVTFTGNAPTIASDAFENDNATVYYSRTDATWRASMRQNYGGTLAWSASCLGNHTPVTDAAVAPTCTQPGKTEGSHCIYCNEVLAAQKEIPAKGHTPEAVAGKDATCTESGLTEGSKCADCGTVLTEQKEIPAKGHTPEAVAGKEATCTEPGLTDGSKCAVCGTVLTEQKEIPAKGHIPKAVAGKDATCTESGLTEGSKCAVCGTVLTEQKTIAALGHSFTKYTYNNDAKAGVDGTETAKCDRCGVTDTRTAAGTALPKIIFTDVPAGKYYSDAVAWAVDNGITNGTTATTFSPDNACNRGQIVTFLWRYAGKPIAQNRNNPFTDVKEGSFCYEAVLWAAEQGITTGKTATTFCPAETCNRGQIVTFLWRYAGKPAPQNQNRQFVDVAAGSFCDQAVMWAVENQITLGVDATHFDPTGECTRAQAVTFLYRGRDLLKK